MAGIRSFISNNPKLGWTVALGVFVIAAAVIAIQLKNAGPPDSIARRSEDVTLRCTETGNEWTMNRGEFERALMTYQGELTPDGMFPSKFADGRPVAILVDRSDWQETVSRINAAKEAYGGQRRGTGG